MKVTNKSLIAQAERTARTPGDLINKLPAGVVQDSYIQVSRNKGGGRPPLLKRVRGKKNQVREEKRVREENQSSTLKFQHQFNNILSLWKSLCSNIPEWCFDQHRVLLTSL